MVIKFNKRTVFYILLIILIILLMFRYVFKAEIPRILLTALIVIAAMLGSQDEILAITMCCIPLHNAVNLYISVLACAAILVVKNHNRIRIGYPVILVSVMIVWELLHCFVYDWSFDLLLVSLTMFIFLAVILSTDMQGVDYAFIVRTMTFFIFCISITHLMNHIVHADGDLVKAFNNLRRLGWLSDEASLFGGDINPNTLGVINVLGVTALLQLRFSGQKKGVDLFLLIASIVFGLLTMSRTFLVCLCIMAILLWLAQHGSVKKIRFLITVLITIFLLQILINWMFPGLFTKFAERFQVRDITTGRIYIIRQYHEYILHHPQMMFFGVGLCDFAEKVVNVFQISVNVPHNSIQEIIAAWGIPGLFMIVLLIMTLILESKKCGTRKRLLNYIPLIIILAKSMAGQLLTSGYSMLALAFAYLSLCQDFTPKNNLERLS